jgi:hypothetical protein
MNCVSNRVERATCQVSKAWISVVAGSSSSGNLSARRPGATRPRCGADAGFISRVSIPALTRSGRVKRVRSSRYRRSRRCLTLKSPTLLPDLPVPSDRVPKILWR